MAAEEHDLLVLLCREHGFDEERRGSKKKNQDSTLGCLHGHGRWSGDVIIRQTDDQID